MRKRVLALPLALLLLSGCGGGDAVLTPGADGFRMAQESSVRGETFRGQEAFADFLSRAEAQFIIPGLNQGMTPQGIAYSEETGLVYISSYGSGGMPSAISAVSPETGEQTAEYFLFHSDGTPFTGHVGGIAAAEGRLCLSAGQDGDGSYSVAVLSLDGLPGSGSHDIAVEETVPLPVSPSFLGYSQGTLWVGNFYHPPAGYGLPPEIPYTTPSADGEYGCYILGYPLREDGLTVPAGETYPIPGLVLAAPDKIQGMARLEDGVVLSQSYGRETNSALLVYDLAAEDPPDTSLEIRGRAVPAYVLDSRRLRERLAAMPMTEGAVPQPGGRAGAVRVRLQPLRQWKLPHRPGVEDERGVISCRFCSALWEKNSGNLQIAAVNCEMINVKNM